jgi:ABC-2 type transport system permease protein
MSFTSQVSGASGASGAPIGGPRGAAAGRGAFPRVRGLRGDWAAFAATATREWRTVRRYPDLLYGSVLWPLLVPVIWVFEVKAFSGGNLSGARLGSSTTVGVAQIAGFLYLGWLVASWIGTVLGEMSSSLQTQMRNGTMETALLSPASRVSLLLGPAPVYALIGLLGYCATALTVSLAFGLHVTFVGLAEGAGIMLLSAPALAALGALLSVSIILMRSTGGLVDCVRAIFAAVCGFTFPLSVLPAWAAHLGRALPPTWITSDLRWAVIREPGGTSVGLLLIGLTVTTLILTWAALASLAAAERRARRTGTLGAF